MHLLRRLVASRDIKPGEAVIVENSLFLAPTIQVDPAFRIDMGPSLIPNIQALILSLDIS